MCNGKERKYSSGKVRMRGTRPRVGTGDGPASPGGDAPPILFRLAEKECAVHGGRKRRLGAKRRLWRLFCLNTGVVRIHAAETCQAPAGCAVPPRNRERAPRIWYCAASFRGGHRKGFTISPARSASLRAPPSIPGREIQRGGAAAPPLCVVRGCGGNRRSAASGG